jgi:hypothetical protein
VPCEELTLDQARKRELLLASNLSRVFAVPDGTLDGWKLMGRQAGADRSLPLAPYLGGSCVLGHDRGVRTCGEARLTASGWWVRACPGPVVIGLWCRQRLSSARSWQRRLVCHNEGVA